jgi:hypothetical protein
MELKKLILLGILLSTFGTVSAKTKSDSSPGDSGTLKVLHKIQLLH